MSLSRHTIESGSAQAQSEMHTGADAEAVRQQCARVLADPIFSHSKRCSGLLDYIVERTLTGEHECLKERIIGIEVFGRSPDYNTGNDATVRSAVVEVRKRLSRYYEAPEHRDDLRIDLPPGTYIAEFHVPVVAPPEPLPDVLREEPLPSNLLISWKRYVAIASGVLCVVVLGFLGVRWLLPVSPIDRFWSPLLNAAGPVLITIGEPASPQAQVDQDASGADLAQFIAQQANFPIAEINAANALNAFLGRHGKQAAIRLAPSTSLSDLRVGPAIMLGNSSVNQWQQRLGLGLHFKFRADQATDSSWIEEAGEPDNRQWAIKFDQPYQQIKSEYALVTRTYDSSTGQWWIGIGGESVLGTIAAQQMMMDPSGGKALVSQLPRGWESKNVQIVLGFDMVDGSLGASHVLKTYVW